MSAKDADTFCLGGMSEYQKVLDRRWAEALAKADAKVGSTLHIRIPENFTIADQPIVKMEGRITRFDPSTKTRVPVTQEWVDEAVAEIVRLNQEVDANNASRSVLAAVETHQFFENLRFPCDLAERLAALRAAEHQPNTAEQDRIWEAVRAASAV